MLHHNRATAENLILKCLLESYPTKLCVFSGYDKSGYVNADSHQKFCTDIPLPENKTFALFLSNRAKLSNSVRNWVFLTESLVNEMSDAKIKEASFELVKAPLITHFEVFACRLFLNKLRQSV